MFTIYANKNGLDVREQEPMTSGSVKVYKAHFEFSSYWNGFDRVAVFSAGGVRIDVALPEDNTCYVPWEVLERSGQEVIVGVYGMNNNQVLPTIWGILGTVERGVVRGDDGIPEPTPQLYEQLMTALRQKGDELRLEVAARSASYKLQLLSEGEVVSEVPLLLPTPGDEGTFDHEKLQNRSLANQHPIEAITGLSDKLSEMEEGNTNVATLVETLVTTQAQLESRLSDVETQVETLSSTVSSIGLDLLSKATSMEVNGEGQLVLKAGNTVLSTVDISTGEGGGGASVIASDVPVGTVAVWMGSTNDPALKKYGWIACDGAKYIGLASPEFANDCLYPELSNFFNTTYGSESYFGGGYTGHASPSFFATPDLQSMLVRGGTIERKYTYDPETDTEIATITETVGQFGGDRTTAESVLGTLDRSKYHENENALAPSASYLQVNWIIKAKTTKASASGGSGAGSSTVDWDDIQNKPDLTTISNGTIDSILQEVTGYGVSKRNRTKTRA